MCVCVCVCVKSQLRHLQYYVIHRELIDNLCLVLHQTKACEGQEVQSFPSKNVNYTTQYYSLLLCILRRENKCHCDCLLSNTVHILWHLLVI